MTTEFLGVQMGQWLWATGLLVVTYAAVALLFKLLAAYLRRMAARTKTDVDDLIADLLKQTQSLFVLLVAVWVASRSLGLPEPVAESITKVLWVGLLIQAGIWVTGVTGYVLARFARNRLDEDPGAASALGALRVVAVIFIWAVVSLTALATFGVNVSALVAGLGIGGLAIALAVQNILGDLFAAVTILLDKPFQVGDFIVVGDSEGTVEHVGLKTTRLVALSGEQLVVANSDLLASRIHNFKRMDERRVAFTVDVEYGVPHSVLARIPTILKEVISEQEPARFDRAHFKSYGDSALVFEAVYWMKMPDFIKYRDTHQAINLGIYERFAAEGIDFAFPSRTLYVRSDESSPELAGPKAAGWSTEAD